MAVSPRLMIFAGSNGAGKTTFATEFLAATAPEIPFINVDDIARDISPTMGPARIFVAAGRIALDKQKALLAKRQSFAIETTLAGNRQRRLARRVLADGWTVDLLYLWVGSPQIAMRRVARRVQAGGHDVPPGDIVRRYHRSLANLPSMMKIATQTTIFDNRNIEPSLIANHDRDGTTIYDRAVFQRILPEMLT